MDLRPVYHLGATLGEKVPFWVPGRFWAHNFIVAKAKRSRAHGEN
jgi:hypothetical protein